MKILHAYCLNYNLGDHALGYGVKKVLRELLPVDFIAETNLQGQVFDKCYIDLINSKYDLLVIGGGGIIHGAHWPQGWFWLIEREMISHLKIPFVTFAAGYNYFKDEEGIPDRGVQHLKETARLARLFSVRNDGSHARLKKQTGIDAKVIADPGFWIGRNESFPRPPGIPNEYIVLQLANDKPSHRFGDQKKQAEFVTSIRAVVASIARRYQVILAPHVFEDVSICTEVARGIENTFMWPFSDFAFDRVEKIFGYYQHAKCVLAMRGHGQIIPLSFGVPTISLENHHKHRELMELIGLGRYNIDVRDKMLTEKAIDLINSVIAEKPAIEAHLQNQLSELWGQTKSTIQSAFRC